MNENISEVRRTNDYSYTTILIGLINTCIIHYAYMHLCCILTSSLQFKALHNSRTTAFVFNQTQQQTIFFANLSEAE